MLKFCSLFSSSDGNSLFIKSDSFSIFIDAGVRTSKIVNALSSIGENINNINAILITHEHSDHIKGLSVLSKKYNIPVFANKETWNFLPKDKIIEENQKQFNMYKELKIGDLNILLFEIPHDAINPSGFNITVGNSKISVATDLGHVTQEIFNLLKNSKFIMLESNYDPEVLKCSSYPYKLKTRIAGPNGHLSNNTAGKVISRLVNNGLKSVMLGHLSKETNFPELAMRTVIEELQSCNISHDAINLNIATRICPSTIINIA